MSYKNNFSSSPSNFLTMHRFLPPLPQGIPLKYESSTVNPSAIKHNVKSLITSPVKISHSAIEAAERERAKYEDVKASERVRHTSVVNSTSVLRSTHTEAGKAQLSPGMYDDSNARRTPTYTSTSMSRGSPLLRGQEGMNASSLILSPFYFPQNVLLLL